jgi:hypothetical protein
MEEMREYAGVCSKLEHNYTLAIEENEKLANELSDQKDLCESLRLENSKILEHLKEYEERVKEYEQ